MTVTVLYFAVIRDLVGIDSELIELPPSIATIDDLASHLACRHPSLEGRLRHVRFARNEEFAGGTELIQDNDVVALIPPVAGG